MFKQKREFAGHFFYIKTINTVNDTLKEKRSIFCSTNKIRRSDLKILYQSFIDSLSSSFHEIHGSTMLTATFNLVTRVGLA